MNARNPEKENDTMNDQALSSDDTKTVRYRIIFTKRNFETTLLERESTVNYATDPMSLSGRKIADFWAKAVAPYECLVTPREEVYPVADIEVARRRGLSPIGDGS